jgi:hypothetical protein
MKVAALSFFCAFVVIASIDAFYFHFYRFRLHERPESRREHLLHTLNACLLPFSAGPLLLGEAGGGLLWMALIANLCTFLIESIDVLQEQDSRRNLGGLPPAEYWMHFTMSGLRWAWVSLAMASIPAPLYFGDSFWTGPEKWTVSSILISAILIGSIPIAILHGVLGVRGFKPHPHR